MVLTWFVGFNGLTAGCTTVRYLREASVIDVGATVHEAPKAEDPMQAVLTVYGAARLAAMSEARNVTFPIGVAHILLGGMLLVASAMAMAGRPGARSLALQAILATAVLALIEYALTQRVRAAAIEALVRADVLRAALPPDQALLFDQRLWWWVDRIRLVLFDLGTLGLAAFALTRRRTMAYFDAVAHSSESAEEP